MFEILTAKYLWLARALFGMEYSIDLREDFRKFRRWRHYEAFVATGPRYKVLNALVLEHAETVISLGRTRDYTEKKKKEKRNCGGYVLVQFVDESRLHDLGLLRGRGGSHSLG